jgi:hypothetical protein
VSNWHAFGKKADTNGGSENTTPHPTMNLHLVIRKDGSQRIEQLVEYRSSKGLVVSTEWVEIPVIYE